MAKNEKKVRIFSALEVANICGVVNQTAINWIKNEYLKAFQTPGGQYRVYAEDLADFLNERKMRMPPELQKILDEQMSIEIVLIVDDDRESNTALRRGLEAINDGFTIYQAFDGFDAGRLTTEKKPQLILLDINLPGIDGFRLCKNFKEDESLNNPLIISISGMDNPELAQKIMESGADAFFSKPIDISKLAAKIEELARTRRRRPSHNA
jgi:PleD family two-component response regulator